MNKNNVDLHEDEEEIDIDEGMDEEDTEELEEVMTSEDHLESVLFQFVALYELWLKDRKRDRLITARRSAKLTELVKQLAREVSRFEKLEERVRGDIHASIRKEAENTALYFGETIGEAARKEVAPTIKKLEDAAADARRKLISYDSEFTLANWKMIGLTAITTLFTSLLIVFFLMPKPVIPITDQQLEYLKFGETLRYVWPKLSKAEQEHIKKLAVDVENAKIGKERV